MDRETILQAVGQYYEAHHKKAPYQPGGRINYAGRVYDGQELYNMVDAALDFWLTAGRYTEQFERGLADYLGVPFCSMVNSGSSANLLAVSALASPLLGERRLPGRRLVLVMELKQWSSIGENTAGWASRGCGGGTRSSQWRRAFQPRRPRLSSAARCRYLWMSNCLMAIWMPLSWSLPGAGGPGPWSWPTPWAVHSTLEPV